MRAANRSHRYRRRGPDRRPLSKRLFQHGKRKQRALRRRRIMKRVRFAGAAAVPVAVGLTSLRKRLDLPQTAAVLIACTAPVCAVIATPPGSRRRYIAGGAAYMWLFGVTWEMPADDSGNQRRRVRLDYPIKIDSFLGRGVPPGLRLQRALRDPDRVSLLDMAVTLVYGSWFLPHALLAYVLLRHEDYLPRAAGRLSAAYGLTTPFYWAIPTAPPWWASEHRGRMDGEVDRVVRKVVCHVFNRPSPTPGETPGNPWGSMPSDHIASAAITAMGLWEVRTAYGVAGWTYVVAASFAVVYLGEHYLTDVLAGLAIAEIVRRGEPIAVPIARTIAHAME